MNLNPLQILSARVPIKSAILALLLALYAAFAIVFFIYWMNPSLNGLTDQRIAADSSTYIYMAEVLRKGLVDPAVYSALARFPNTLWMPVFIAYFLKSTIWIAVLDVMIFVLSLLLFKRAARISLLFFIALLLMNLTTTVSLLSVNKEIIDLLVAALFCYRLSSNRKRYGYLALLLAFLNRWEISLALLTFLFLKSKLNPWRTRRWRTLILFVCFLTVVLPLLASKTLALKFEEAQGAVLIAFFDKLEMNYLFVVAVLPKIAQNLFGEFFSPTAMGNYSFQDLANSWILLSNNIATTLVFVVLWMKGRLRIRSVESDWLYLAGITSVVMAISLVIQPRYFYFVYVLLCFEAAQQKIGDMSPGALCKNRPKVLYA
jgi:hypothetical protein